MTVFQKGDKVRDVKVGTVHHASHDGVVVYFPDNPNYHTVWMPDRLELVERPTPPVKVGDKVTAENVNTLPVMTVIIADQTAFQLSSDFLWHEASHRGDRVTSALVVRWTTTTIVYLPE